MTTKEEKITKNDKGEWDYMAVLKYFGLDRDDTTPGRTYGEKPPCLMWNCLLL
ncbi:MAG: hypothetical protein GF347_01610 [Candidatus Moranbacteria bacterium]|nr:hypothetical protein [Candidatus Moranbacteria bacterium]